MMLAGSVVHYRNFLNTVDDKRIIIFVVRYRNASIGRLFYFSREELKRGAYKGQGAYFFFLCELPNV